MSGTAAVGSPMRASACATSARTFGDGSSRCPSRGPTASVDPLAPIAAAAASRTPSRRDRRARAPARAPLATWARSESELARREPHPNVGVAEPRNHAVEPRPCCAAESPIGRAQPHVVVRSPSALTKQRRGSRLGAFRRATRPLRLRSATSPLSRALAILAGALGQTNAPAAAEKAKTPLKASTASPRTRAEASTRPSKWPGTCPASARCPVRVVYDWLSRLDGDLRERAEPPWPGPCASLRRNAGSARRCPP